MQLNNTEKKLFNYFNYYFSIIIFQLSAGWDRRIFLWDLEKVW